MRFLSVPLRRFGPAALMLGVLTSCEAVVVEEPGSLPPPEAGICSREYQPVCARRGGDIRTFGNECLADAAGYRTRHGGECRDDYRPVPPRESACSREYDPVCGSRDGHNRTFANDCLADTAGYRVRYGGECRADEGAASGGGGDRFCTREYRPVCARRGGNVRTFGNECEARGADYRVISDGPCSG